MSYTDHYVLESKHCFIRENILTNFKRQTSYFHKNIISCYRHLRHAEPKRFLSYVELCGKYINLRIKVTIDR